MLSVGGAAVAQTDLLDLIPPHKRTDQPTPPAASAPTQPAVVSSMPWVDRPASRTADRRPAESAPAQGMLLDRPPVPVTPPSGEVATAPRYTRAPESAAAARRAVLAPDTRSSWVALHMEQSGDQPAETRWILPCPLLDSMQQTDRQAPGAVFIVSCETTSYRDMTYVLPRRVVVEAAAPGMMAPVVPASAPASSPARVETPEEIMARLLRSKPGKPLLVPVDSPPPAAVPSASPASRPALPLGQGNVLSDRVVQVVPEKHDGWLTAVFVGDNTLQEPPMRLLPCRMLERAQKLAATESQRTPVLIVSGEVFPYRGYNYLLLRKVLLQRELRQFD
jgi:hypothetical protein